MKLTKQLALRACRPARSQRARAARGSRSACGAGNRREPLRGAARLLPVRSPNRLDAQNRRRAPRLAAWAAHRQIAGPVAASTVFRRRADRLRRRLLIRRSQARRRKRLTAEEPGDARLTTTEKGCPMAIKHHIAGGKSPFGRPMPYRPLPPTALAAARFTTYISRQMHLERRFVSRSRQRRPRTHNRHWRRQRCWR
jgi:hypothetical protein